jgi:hypothetical protein
MSTQQLRLDLSVDPAFAKYRVRFDPCVNVENYMSTFLSLLEI